MSEGSRKISKLEFISYLETRSDDIHKETEKGLNELFAIIKRYQYAYHEMVIRKPNKRARQTRHNSEFNFFLRKISENQENLT